MSESSNDAEKQAISWQVVMGVIMTLVVMAKFMIFGITPFDMILAYVTFASYIVRDWRVGTMTPERWKAFWQITAINLCVTAFMCL